ncbi:MAG TPA: glutathione peroxidase [Chitinophagaceae bacterium]|nr:glutathione peroxidase [Chitinophagaceae bacterium]
MKKKDMSYRQSILKSIYPMIMWSTHSNGKKQSLENKNGATPSMSFYDLTMTAIDGTLFNFSNVKGKKILIVNTASDCGYTGQYEALEKLQQQYKEQLVVIGFPANDFKGQEKSDNQNIAAFCKKNYGVSFPLMEKSIVIKKNQQNLVHKWLSDPSQNGWCNQEPVWNFCKYLINEQGVLVNYFPMTIDPLDPLVIAAIEKK